MGGLDWTCYYEPQVHQEVGQKQNYVVKCMLRFNSFLAYKQNVVDVKFWVASIHLEPRLRYVAY